MEVMTGPPMHYLGAAIRRPPDTRDGGLRLRLAWFGPRTSPDWAISGSSNLVVDLATRLWNTRTGP